MRPAPTIALNVAGYDMHWEDQSNLEKMLHASLQLLNDPELPVRVCAALALPETTRYPQGASRWLDRN